MNTAILKNYAPAARRDFLRAVTDRAAKVGVTASSAAPVEVRGDIALIAGQPFPRQAAEQRKALDYLIQRNGFQAVMEQAAYTWFNRFMAIRFMELHAYLSHGYRVLSNANGSSIPEIMEHAEEVTLPDVSRERVIELKLDGTKDEELYKLLLLGQCRALHNAMPFLFEAIDDVTELLLPDLLLATDSVIRKMVYQISEADWNQVEVIGWLYQFYISEKKDEVIGEVVESKDIPAATQLFTPNWIVKYMTQNSLGRQWMATYPQSPLKTTMEYYIEPADQTAEVQAHLDSLTPKSLSPEEITLIDPACGSGHILVEAYDLFKGIYLERGYRLRDIPRLILTKNLFGLEIDDRAAQMAGFALLMKARTDDRTIFDNTPQMNVLSFQTSAGMNASEIAGALLKEESTPFEPPMEMFAETKAQPVLTERRIRSISEKDIAALINAFTEAKTFGSLIKVPSDLVAKLPDLMRVARDGIESENVLKQSLGDDLAILVEQAMILQANYDICVTNPPYMSSKGMNRSLKEFARKQYSSSKSDLFAMFIERGFTFASRHGFNVLVTMQSWMFLQSFEVLRSSIFKSRTILHLTQIGYNSFPELNSKIAQACAFVLANHAIWNYIGTYVNLNAAPQSADKNLIFLNRGPHNTYTIAQDIFQSIPGGPVTYWVSDKIRAAFESDMRLESVAPCRQGLATTDNKTFLRHWWELSINSIGWHMHNREEATESALRWFPYNKGGAFRRWYGNCEHVVDWEFDGKRIRHSVVTKYPYLNGNDGFVVKNTEYYFRESVTWTFVSSAYFAVRYCPQGFIFDVAGSSAFPSPEILNTVLCFLSSSVATILMEALNPTLNFQVGNVAALPLDSRLTSEERQVFDYIGRRCVEISRADWNDSEISWAFDKSPVLSECLTVHESVVNCESIALKRFQELKLLEIENNRLWIETYGLQGELLPDVHDDQVTISRPAREQYIRHFISYTTGCLMGRYSVDEPGLIYAHTGGEHFDASRYKSIPADDDGILPIVDIEWFGDEDVAIRIAKFVAAAWSIDTLEENLKFIADSLNPKSEEQPLVTIRRYLATAFYKDHLQTYKRRPIYWLFSSGKERAFQALVYLHRYNEGTLARMRTEYVQPLLSKMTGRIELLRVDIDASPSAVERRRRSNEFDKLRKQTVELQTFDEKLRHYSDRRIRLDLDDGVKLNYAKFGDLLAEVKAVTGGSDD